MDLERLRLLYSAKMIRFAYISIFLIGFSLGYLVPQVLSAAERLVSMGCVFLLLLSFFVVPASRAKNVKKVLQGFIFSQFALSISSSSKGMILFLALAGAVLVYFGAIGSVKRALLMEDHEVNLTIGAFSGLSLLLIGPGIYRDGWSAHHSGILGIFALRDFLCFHLVS